MKPTPTGHTRVYCREANGARKVFDVQTLDHITARETVIENGIKHGVVVSLPVLAIVNTEAQS